VSITASISVCSKQSRPAIATYSAMICVGNKRICVSNKRIIADNKRIIADDDRKGERSATPSDPGVDSG
jgi:hypothetical protein